MAVALTEVEDMGFLVELMMETGAGGMGSV